MKQLYLFSFILLFLLVSCRSGKRTDSDQPQETKSALPLAPEYTVQHLSGKSVIRLADLYPVDLDFYASSLYIITVKSDTSIYVFDRNTYKQTQGLGIVGSGPQDVFSPEFVSNNYELKDNNGGVAFHDSNARKIFYADESNQLVEWKLFTDVLASVRGLNISGDYWIGQRIRTGEENMFHIYNEASGRTIEIGYYPELPDLEKIDKNYLYALNITANHSKDRIIAGMYFFDLIQIYDFQGNRISTLSLSPDYKPETVLEGMKDNKDYISYPRIYSTADYCYLCRKLKGCKATQLIRLTWNGKVNAVYQFDEPINACCVDEAKGELYTISQKIDIDSEEEFYDIMLYHLPQ